MAVLMLRYRGNGAYRPGLPAHDLDRAELDAIAAGRKVDVDALVEEAVGSGLYLPITDAPEADDSRGATAALAGDGAGSGLERHRALKARAKELGLPATGKVAELEAAIAAAETRLAEEAAAAAKAAADASGSGEGDALGTVLAERTDDELAALAAEAGLEPGQSRDAVIAALVAITEGTSPPADDPAAPGAGEAGTPSGGDAHA